MPNQHRFAHSKAANAEFKGEGLRPFFLYRDLGIDDATNGEFGAMVIKAAAQMEVDTVQCELVCGEYFPVLWQFTGKLLEIGQVADFNC